MTFSSGVAAWDRTRGQVECQFPHTTRENPLVWAVVNLFFYLFSFIIIHTLPLMQSGVLQCCVWVTSSFCFLFSSVLFLNFNLYGVGCTLWLNQFNTHSLLCGLVKGLPYL